MSWGDTFTPSTPASQGASEQGTAGAAAGGPEGEAERPVVRDKRRLDPETGQVRPPPEGDAQGPGTPVEADAPVGADDPAGAQAVDGVGSPDPTQELTAALTLAQERLGDMQRLQAEYVNYRRRVERDRDVAREAGVVSVLEALLPALDDVALARQHGDLQGGPFAAIAEKLEAALSRVGLESYGAEGEEFDPAVHEALLHSSAEDATTTTVTTVLQPGYRTATRVLRPARVAVTSPA